MIRVVKMTFQPERVKEFLFLFESVQPKIAAFKGCNGVELLQDTAADNIFFTFSNWDTAGDLEVYRSSELFRNTWTTTKLLFLSRAEAWSLEKIS